MAFKYNGNVPKKITYNSQNVKRLIYNGTVIWTAPNPIYWFNCVVNSDGNEEQVLTDGYQGEWKMTSWCCDELNYVDSSYLTKDIWYINPVCNSSEHGALFRGIASGATGSTLYATIYVSQMASGCSLTANETKITTAGIYDIDVSGATTLNLEIIATGLVHINYIYFHS